MRSTPAVWRGVVRCGAMRCGVVQCARAAEVQRCRGRGGEGAEGCGGVRRGAEGCIPSGGGGRRLQSIAGCSRPRRRRRSTARSTCCAVSSDLGVRALNCPGPGTRCVRACVRARVHAAARDRAGPAVFEGQCLHVLQVWVTANAMRAKPTWWQSIT
eukprot:scaffold69623_cov52-Phaeocystis_antarctica.AAC.1